MKTSEMTMSNIFTHIKDKYKNDKDTKVFLLASERASNKIRDLDKVSVSAKNLWILVETTKIRTDIRQEIANDFNIRKFYSSSSSVDQIKIDDFIKDTGKYKKIESIRIIFKYPPRFVLSNFKWANKTLESKVKTLGKPDNIYEVNILNQINFEFMIKIPLEFIAWEEREALTGFAFINSQKLFYAIYKIWTVIFL